MSDNAMTVLDFDVHGLQQVLPLLRTPSGALMFIPLYALWVTLLLPGSGCNTCT